MLARGKSFLDLSAVTKVHPSFPVTTSYFDLGNLGMVDASPKKEKLVVVNFD
jgi:hypothetical protein